LRNDRRTSIDPPRSGSGSVNTYREIDETALAGIHARAIHRDRSQRHANLVGKIKIEPAGMLSDAGMDYLLAAIKLRARFSRPVFDYPTNLNPTAAKW
jgi:hypothetical protein